MRKSLYAKIILVVLIFLAGCINANEKLNITATSTIAKAEAAVPTSTFTRIPQTATRTPTITRTPVPTKRPTITTTPTVPPFYQTPTFDPATIVTATKSPNATCPETDQTFQPTFPDQGPVYAGNYPDSQITLQNAILDALNRGATLAALQSAITKATGNGTPLEIKANALYLKELTGDTIAEVVFKSYYRFAIFTCINGHYVLGLDMPSGGLYQVDQLAFEDLNQDHLPEVVVGVHDHVAVEPGIYLFVFRWDGEAFRDLILADNGYDFYLPDTKSFGFCCNWKYEFKDIDRNGLKEIVVQEAVGHHAEAVFFGPWRDITEIVAWNGAGFALLPEQLTPAVYRFQVAQDGDRALQRWDFEEALKQYQRVLDDKKLKGWSEAQFQQVQDTIMAQGRGTPTPTPLPDDQSDYATLAAYAKFKILLIHAAQGKVDQASAEYENLQQAFPQGQPGSGFASMAKAFWDEYSSGQGLAAGCVKAQAYADGHLAETSKQIDVTWHGRQSPDYISKFHMCPFK